MLHLRALGWGLRRIAREFGCSKNTVKRYVGADGWMAYSRRAGGGKLEEQEAWLKERFFQHHGNAEVVRQDLVREQGIDVSLRTVERAVAPFRRLLTAEAKATVRFETPPGRQLQVDFGQRRVPIADERVRVYLLVATLGYSRRCYVAAFRHERQSSWFRGFEGAFHHFGGVTREVLIDNPRPLVVDHDAETREVEFNRRFLAFAAYWGFRPRACAPYRARTKGKDERGVGDVKGNAIAGHRFESWAGMEAHLGWWQREIADPTNLGDDADILEGTEGVVGPTEDEIRAHLSGAMMVLHDLDSRQLRQHRVEQGMQVIDLMLDVIEFCASKLCHDCCSGRLSVATVAEPVPDSGKSPRNPAFVGKTEGLCGSERVRKRLTERETAGSTAGSGQPSGTSTAESFLRRVGRRSVGNRPRSGEIETRASTKCRPGSPGASSDIRRIACSAVRHCGRRLGVPPTLSSSSDACRWPSCEP